MLREFKELPVTLLTASDVSGIDRRSTLSEDALLPDTRRVRPLRHYVGADTAATSLTEIELPDWLYEFAEAMRRLLALPSGWDSYGALRIKPEVALHAFEVLSALSITRDQLPTFVPRSDGGIQLEWHVLSGDMEIIIRPSGKVSAYWDAAESGSEWESEEVYDYAELGTRLFELLSDKG